MAKNLEAEIRKLVKKVNDSLYRLEKAGVQNMSNEYQLIEYYAIEKDSPYYNVNLKQGTIRATKDLKRIGTKRADLYRYKNVLEGILEADTRTVTGTREAIKKSYDWFLKEQKEGGLLQNNPKMDFDNYKRVFQIYREKVNPDRKDHAGSAMVLAILNSTNMYQISKSGIERALKYAKEHSEQAMLLEFFEQSKNGTWTNTGKIRKQKGYKKGKK